ncbi:MAG: hypothetical protein QOI11_1848, partial [Candidatus Eremiobacteraeota bacterium]|nr:hypothetical protein [Candidatus Eremiobacteraeota bacterium]
MRSIPSTWELLGEPPLAAPSELFHENSKIAADSRG